MADGKVVIDTELDNSGIEKDLKDVKKELEKAEKAVEDYGDEFEEAGKKSDKSRSDIKDDLDDVKKSVNDLGNIMKTGIGLDLLAGFAKDLLDSTQELRGDLSMLGTNAANAQVGIDTATEAFKRLNTVSGEADSSVEAVSNLLAAGVPENKLQDAVEGLANAAIKFPDTIKIESLADSLQETLATGSATGQFGELLDRLGIGAENFNNNLALIPDEASRLDYALSILNQGSLQGVYDGWAATNPELVEGRDSAMELQQAMSELADEIAPIVTDVTDFSTALISWTSRNVDIQSLFQILVAGIGALAAVRAIETIKGIATAIGTMSDKMFAANIQTMAAVAVFGILIALLIQVAKNWDNMSGAEKVIAILGAVAVAAAGAAIAVGALQSALTMGIAAAAIVAGIAAIMVAVGAAQNRAAAMKPATANGTSTFSDIPQLATGAVIPPNRRFTAVLGDQRNGRNLEAPEGLIRQIVREESGAGGVNIRFSGSLAQLARVLKPEIETVSNNSGKHLVGG